MTRRIAWHAALLVVLTTLGWAPDGASHQTSNSSHGGRLPTIGAAPEFALTTHDGTRLALPDLRGKVVAVTFIYASCVDTCPLLTTKMAGLQNRLGHEFGRRVVFVSITVDPEHDTADVLARYAERYRADPERWLFLTGPKGAIYALAKEGFKLAVQDASPSAGRSPALSILGPPPAYASHGSKGLILHSSRFVLVDRRGRIRAYHRTDDPESLVKLRDNVRTLLGQS